MVATGRRERKKAATRSALADAALELFLARGYEDVTVAEIADAADVSVTTLFNHFPGGKPALVFDEAQAREDALVVAVRDRGPEVGVIQALHEHLRETRSIRPPSGTGTEEHMRAFLALVHANRPLVEYFRGLWSAQEAALAAAITETGTAPGTAAALAHLVVDGFLWAGRQPDPADALDRVMALLGGAAPG